MGDILALFGGSLGGSIIGGLGAAFSKWHDGKIRLQEAKLQLERETALNKHELAMQSAQTEAAVKQMEYAALNTSLEMDKASYSVGKESKALIFVDVVRGLVRPILTAALLGYCMITLFYLTTHYNVEFTETQVYDLVFLIVHNLVTCSGIALTWWFGSRTVGGK